MFSTRVLKAARPMVDSGEKLGAELFLVGPLFTTAGGHGTEYATNIPEMARRAVSTRSFCGCRRRAEEAQTDGGRLCQERDVDGIKTMLEAGRPDPRSYAWIRRWCKAIAASGARKCDLPVVCHTGNARDVEDAVNAGVDGIEHGSMTDAIPEAVFAKMKQAGITFDPTLDRGGGVHRCWRRAISDMLDRSLVQQVGPPKKLLESTKKFLHVGRMARRCGQGFAKFPSVAGAAAIRI